MLKALFAALNVRPKEEHQVLLLLGKGFFMGIFLATYQISAETLFLNRMEHYLKEAILFSGILGILTTALFSYLQNRITFSKLTLGNLLLICAATFAMYIIFEKGSPGVQDYMIFIMFALTGPIMAVCLLGFWGIFGRLFDLRQSKRIIGGIDIGQLSAAILASLTIPFLGKLIPDTADYFLISGVSLLISSIFLLFISSNFDLSKAEISNVQGKVADTSARALTKDKYVKLMSIFLIFSMIAFTFVQFSFQNVVASQYPDEDDLRNFLSFFTLAILILGLLMQTFVNDKIISEYGLKVTLTILPVILMLFTVGAIVAGNLFGYTTSDQSSFIWFFLLIAVSRLFNFSLRDSLENPTFKLYFMPLDNRIRFNIQTKVEGVVNEVARLIAGVLILGLSYLTFFELIHYSYFLVVVIIGYFFVIGQLHNGYRTKIKIKLEQQRTNSDEEQQSITQKLTDELSESLTDARLSKVVFSFKLLEKIDPQLLPNSINRMMGHDSPEIRDFAQNKMSEIKGMDVSDRYVISLNDKPSAQKQVLSGMEILDLIQSGDIANSRVSKLAKSVNWEDRQYAAELLANTEEKENISFLIELLHDVNPKVRLAAIKTSQKRYNNEILHALIRNLPNPIYSVPAANVLTLVGGKALSALESAFYLSGQNPVTMQKIVQIMGRIRGNKAKAQLWNKIDYPDKVMMSQVLLALGNAGFKAGINQIPRIKYAIESDIEDIAWNMAAINEVSIEHFGTNIREALKEEIDYDVDHIYMLLSMLYDSQSIQLVKENIESRTNEGITYALELLDVFLSEDLKQRIIPVLDDLSYAEKAKKLELLYPRESLNEKMVLKYLLNRDFSQTNRWTKTCIIYQIGLLEIREFYFDLIANIFNPDPLIREMAAWSLYKMDTEAYEEHTLRIEPIEKKRLDEIIIHSHSKKTSGLRFDKVVFLKEIKIFKNVFGLTLAHLVDITEEIFLKEGDILNISESQNNNFYIVYKGSVKILVNRKMESGISSGEFIGEIIQTAESKNSSIMAVEDTALLKITKDNFYELLSDNVDLARKMVEFV
ncbi:cyclic nucleotide-binding domain-containing protein [Fulvivirga sp. M361]|uniref:HEAT repeat domain-containing protein n=1 Tax=Fulvivirga sp. M361 TaxID=2594266 RepID=UPI00117B1D66|nr:HEAT repeat domain-containing protein [Fulvivirga sp. M361]TRX48138.1 cyclic nucleotide-binding domain-containing protein [Fulvivirga sp. M361]